MGGLLHLVQGGGGAAARPGTSSHIPNVTARPSTTSVPTTVLLYNGLLLCGFRVAIKGLRWVQSTMFYKHVCPPLITLVSCQYSRPTSQGRFQGEAGGAGAQMLFIYLFIILRLFATKAVAYTTKCQRIKKTDREETVTIKTIISKQ